MDHDLLTDEERAAIDAQEGAGVLCPGVTSQPRHTSIGVEKDTILVSVSLDLVERLVLENAGVDTQNGDRLDSEFNESLYVVKITRSVGS